VRGLRLGNITPTPDIPFTPFIGKKTTARRLFQFCGSGHIRFGESGLRTEIRAKPLLILEQVWPTGRRREAATACSTMS